MMILSSGRQAEIFVLSFMLGVCCAFFYDVIKTVRIILPHGRFLSEAEDIIYWAVCGIFTVKYMLEKNSGEIRFFAATAFFSAMLLYHALISFAVEGILEKTTLFLKNTADVIVYIVGFPFKVIWHIMKRPAKKAHNKMKKTGRTVLLLIKKYARIKLITLRAIMRPNKK